MDKQRKAIQSALYHLIDSDPFYGTLLQCLTISFTRELPTAAITYDSKEDQFKILINPEFFCELPLEQRIAILKHEVFHFTNKHLFRLPFISASPEDRQIYNLAGDMSINQLIKDLPTGAINVIEWKLDNGQPFPVLKTMEEYYELIKNNQKHNKEKTKNSKTLDEHIWDTLTEEDKKKLLDEAKKLVKRTMDKMSNSHSTVPDSIKDLLQEIETIASKLNYKDILKKAIKKTIQTPNKMNTWSKPNKRYGNLAPGSKPGYLPKVSFYNDSSGSISVKEMNEFLNIISNFLKVGAKNCTLSLWHTVLYYKKPYKLNGKLNPEDVQSGGTDVSCVLEDIKNTKPNLSIILTDGYYDKSNVTVSSEVIWIISKGGNMNHPMNKIGKTILLENLC